MSYWKIAYQFGWATLDQVKQAVQYKLISADDFKTITGIDYSVPASTQGAKQ